MMIQLLLISSVEGELKDTDVVVVSAHGHCGSAAAAAAGMMGFEEHEVHRETQVVSCMVHIILCDLSHLQLVS